MYNKEILDLIIKEHGVEKAAIFCEIAAMMYDIKYQASKKKDPLTEFDFERMWWIESAALLHEQLIEE